MFDINDFDETLAAPWEWDVKRLAASFVVAGRDRGFEMALRRSMVLELVRTYRTAVRQFAEMRNLDVWYARLNVADLLARVGQEIDKKAVARLDKLVGKARSKNSLRAFEKLAVTDGGDPAHRQRPARYSCPSANSCPRSNTSGCWTTCAPSFAPTAGRCRATAETCCNATAWSTPRAR